MAVLSNASILKGASAAGGSDYNVEKSLRFPGSDDGAHLTKAFSAGGSTTTWTLSFWIKAWDETQACYIFTGGTGTTSYITMDVGQLRFYSNNHDLKTTAKYRDPAAWMHVVCTADTTNGTDNDKTRIYVNGTRLAVGDFATHTQPSASAALGDFNSAATHYINRLTSGSQQDFILADVHFVDAAAKEASDFGKFHSDTGQWIPKKYSGSHGTTGFHLKFNGTDVGEDSAGSNDWTPTGLTGPAPSSVTPPKCYKTGTTLYTNVADIIANGTLIGTDGIGGAAVSGEYCYIVHNDSGVDGTTVFDAGWSANIYGYRYETDTTWTNTGGYNTSSSEWDTWKYTYDGTESSYDIDNNHGTGFTLLTGTGPAVWTGTYPTLDADNFRTLNDVRLASDVSDDAPGSPWDNERNGGGNYAVLNPLVTHDTSPTTAEHLSGHRQGGTQAYSLLASHRFSSSWEFKESKWYFEFTMGTKPTAASGDYTTVGFRNTPDNHDAWGANTAGYYLLYSSNSQMQRYAAAPNDLGTMADGTGFIPGKTYGVAIDMVNRKVWFSMDDQWRDDDWLANGNPVTGANPVFTLPGSEPYYLHIDADNAAINFNFGARPYRYTKPTGYKTCNAYNLPEPAVLDPSKHFGISTWTGDNATSRAIDGLNFQPDMVWGKNRDGNAHQLFDVIRGAGSAKELTPNDDHDEGNVADPNTPVYGWLSAFNSDGFTVAKGSSAGDGNFYWNESGSGHVAWAWNAGTANVDNDASETSIGSIDSTYRVNTDAGFSIVTYTGNNTNPSSVAHGLNAKPAMILLKDRDTDNKEWIVYHKELGATKYMYLNTDSDVNTGAIAWNDTEPTSTVWTMQDFSNMNGSGKKYVAYCWSEVDGYSKFGSYTGESSWDSGLNGPFVYCGFLPRYLMLKQAHSGYNGSWVIYDTKRTPTNSGENWIYANSTAAEAAAASYAVTVHSNGFRIRSTSAENNGDGRNYIFAAFAESSFKYANAK